MIVAERQHQILMRLQEEGAVRTVDLANELGVTDETIRRDLEVLDGQGKLERTHGGALILNHPSRTKTLAERSLINPDLKKAIAREAVRLIQPKDVLFLDASSTVLELARALPPVSLTVITNAHDVISVVSGNSHVKVIGTGGVFDPESRSYYGPSVEEAVCRYRIQRMFFSCNGVDFNRGISESSEDQGRAKEAIFQYTRQVVLLADSTKFGMQSDYFFCSPGRLNVMISDSALKKSFQKQSKQWDFDLRLASE